MTEHVRKGYRGHRKATWGVVAAFVVVLAAAVTPFATGAPPKYYSLTASPTGLCFTGAGQSQEFALTLTNERSNTTLGSAEITAPDFISLTTLSNPPSGVTLEGNVIKLRNLTLTAGGAGVTVTVWATITRAGSGSWTSVAKQSNNFSDAGPGNLFAPLTPTSGSPPLNVSTCTLAFVTQPANPWEKGSTITPPVEVAVFAGTTRVAVDGTPALTASGAGSIANFDQGSATYNATTMSWKWSGLKPKADAPSGLYNLTATLGAMTDTSDSDAGTGGDQPFRVTSSICEPGETCNLTSDLLGPQVQAGITNTLPGSISIDFETGDEVNCEEWNRAFFTNASGDEVHFPGVALDFTWGAKTLQLVYRIRNSEWVLTQVARGNNDIEICAGARHGVDLEKNGDGSNPTPFQGKHGPAVWEDGLYWGVLATVANPKKVKSDPVVCASETQDLPTGPNGATETWRTWTICIPYDWDWKNFG